jgi:long-chain acyl-CoA synthetase
VNLVEMLHESVQFHRDKECIRYKQAGVYKSLTYDELWDDIMHLASGLVQCGVRFGDKVAILANNCPQWAMSDYAVLAIGAVVVPIYPTIPAEQVGYILKNADVSTVIVEDPNQFQKVLDSWPEGLRQAIIIHGDTTQVRVSPDNRRVSWFSEVQELGRLSKSNEIDFHSIPEDQLATIVHTSGTSGNPKGVMLSHRNIVSNVRASLSMMPVKPGDVSLSYLPLSHIFERTVGQFASLYAGASIAYAESIETIPANLLEVRPTLLVTVPRLLEKVYAQIYAKLDHAPKPLRGLIHSGLARESNTGIAYRLVDMLVYRKLRKGLGGRMRALVSGGAALSADIARFYGKAGIPVHEGYGMTEASPVIAVNPLGKSRPGTVGKVIPGVEVLIASDGELWVKGPNVMLGYYGAPEETAECIENGWLHTGDIVEINDGYVKIVDRKKNILVLATGKNVAPAPIENAIALCPYISAAVLVGDGRKYVTCVLSPDVASLRPVAARLDLGTDVTDWVKHLEIQHLIAAEVKRTTSSFAPYEQPKRAVLLAHELTLESGDLTPTLKVKTRILMEKYGQQIQNMYDGINYIALDAGLDTSYDEPPREPPVHLESATPEAESAIHPTQATHRGAFRWIALGSAAALMIGAITAYASGARIPKNLDVLGMIQYIHHNNQQINNENGQIVGNLKNIDNLAGTTSTIGSNLHTLKSGTIQDDASLNNLNQLSQQEIQLSQSFYALAQTLQGNLTKISSAGAAQNGYTSSMVAQAQQLNQIASRLANTNQEVAGKLNQADAKARIIAAEMP